MGMNLYYYYGLWISVSDLSRYDEVRKIVDTRDEWFFVVESNNVIYVLPNKSGQGIMLDDSHPITIDSESLGAIAYKAQSEPEFSLLMDSLKAHDIEYKFELGILPYYM